MDLLQANFITKEPTVLLFNFLENVIFAHFLQLIVRKVIFEIQNKSLKEVLEYVFMVLIIKV